MSSEWRSITKLPPVEAEELQVWRMNLADVTASQATYASYLDREEQDRACRLRAGQVRMQFVVARACLRMLLGAALGLEPHRVSLVIGIHGKPETPAVEGHSLFFNVAHSNSTILIALCRKGAVGVDVEAMDGGRNEMDVMDVARHSFAASEYSKLAALVSPVQRQHAFFRCWTQKEAVAKADGRGLSLSLSSFEVPVDRAQCAPVQVPQPGGGGTLYFVSDLELGDRVAGSFALAHPGCPVHLFGAPPQWLNPSALPHLPALSLLDSV